MAITKRIALQDGDVFAYQAAAAIEREVDWGDGLWTLHSDFDAAMRHAKQAMEETRKACGAQESVFVWSCPTRHYWRNDVHPDYKGGRKVLGMRSPLALKALKTALAVEYESYMMPHLEGDDVLGILATADWYRPNVEKVIVSIDKDMKTIPTYIYNPDKDFQPWLQNEADAFQYYLSQAIGGDTTDGYSGVRGISADGAVEYLKDPYRWESYTHIFKSGARKGERETKWRKTAPVNGVAEAIHSLYEKSGEVDPQEAFYRNALCARILHADEYDWKTGEVLINKIKEKINCI